MNRLVAAVVGGFVRYINHSGISRPHPGEPIVSPCESTTSLKDDTLDLFEM